MPHAPPAEDAFALFGLPRRHAVDGSSLEQALLEAGRRWHPDRFALASAEDRLAAEDQMASIHDAYAVLSDALTRAEELLRLGGVDPTGGQAPPEFLMAMMDLREECDALARSLSTDKSPAARQKVQDKIRSLRAEEKEVLERFTAAHDVDQAEQPRLEELRPLIHQARYLRSTRRSLEDALRSPGP